MARLASEASDSELETLVQSPLLGPDGRLNGELPMSSERVTEALEMMLLSRAIDELCIKLQRLGRVGLYAPVYGQEAAVIGSAMTLDPERDWLVPASREQPAMLNHGLPLANLFASYMGRLEFAGIPQGVKLLPRQQAIAAQMPHATGLAWSLKLRGEQAVVMAYCGDGASSEGDFHEALNLAGVMRVPLVVVLINNRYAISTPLYKQTAAPSLAARGEGYGMPGIAVDGNDIFAVYRAVKAAVARALKGNGPSLIECRTYRLGFHNTSDNPDLYRPAAEVDEALQSDPVTRLERYVLSTKLVSQAELNTLRDGIRAKLTATVRRVDALPRPGPEFMFQHVYATLHPGLEQQMSEAVEDC